jgi:hypothetical protein
LILAPSTADGEVRACGLSVFPTASLCPRHEQIECEEALAPMKEQVIESWLASFVETDNLSV